VPQKYEVAAGCDLSVKHPRQPMSANLPVGITVFPAESSVRLIKQPYFGTPFARHSIPAQTAIPDISFATTTGQIICLPQQTEFFIDSNSFADL
jgi:hypothetical protein